MNKIKSYFIPLLIICTFLLIFFTTAEAIQISENRFIFRIDRAPTQEITVTNNDDYPAGFRVYTEIADNQAEDEYFGDWLMIYPPQFNLEAGESRTVRFSVRPPEDIEDGEFRSLLYFHEEPPLEDPDEGPEAGELDEDQVEVGIRLRMKKGINVYGRYGDLNFTGYLDDLEYNRLTDNEVEVTGKFVNEGNTHLRTNAVVELEDSEGNIVFEDEIRFVVHRGETDTFEAELDLPQNIEEEYTLNITFIGREEDEEIAGDVIYEYQETIVPADI